jgi:hypothetical protein
MRSARSAPGRAVEFPRRHHWSMLSSRTSAPAWGALRRLSDAAQTRALGRGVKRPLIWTRVKPGGIMQRRSGFAIVLIGLAAFTLAVDAQSPTPPPAPTLLAPPSGAALVQPITLRWSAVSDPDGPIGSYTWQLASTSSFTSIIASGFTDLSDGDPPPTEARLSGVPNGSYFWRVRASQLVGGATGSIDSAWRRGTP